MTKRNYTTQLRVQASNADRPLLFSITARDCDWSYTKGTGAGGQKRNKTSSAVHCTHRASGARGYSEATRSQFQNRSDAFVKMSQTETFKKWHRIEVMRRTGELAISEEKVKQSLQPQFVKTEIKINGRWTEVPLTELED